MPIVVVSLYNDPFGLKSMTARTATQPELLAPAGDWEAMRAAVANGADAVYFGLDRFNARYRATNFSVEELPEVMRYLHEHNVRGYVTFNTLIFSDELPDATRFISACASAGVDALIVQDLGIAMLIHAMSPSLPVHGSTQMTLTEPRGVEFVRGLGVSRVILARELSVAEIGRIANATAVPVEVFVHGALCVAYSGQCLTSEALGGRSANRGQCAQACRLPYDLMVDGTQRDLRDKAYLLSPQDLAAYDLVEPLAAAGVCSFKIEGRLKSAHYVAATTQTYRAALDAAVATLPFSISPVQRHDLAQSFSRGFTHGFLDGVNHQQLVHARFPKSRGIRVGQVAGTNDAAVIVRSERGAPMLKPGDGVVFDEGHPEQDEQGGRVLTVRAAGPNLQISFHGGDINLSAVARGAIVWKTDDPAIRKRLEHSYSRETVAKRVALDVQVRAVIGEPLSAVVTDEAGGVGRVASSEPMSAAQKHPLSIELLRDQFGRLGNTPFTLRNVLLHGATEADPAEPIMAPKSVMNDLRRQAIEQLMSQRASSAMRPVLREDALDTMRHDIAAREAARAETGMEIEDVKLSVLVRSLEQLRAVLDWTPAVGERPEIVHCDFEDIRGYKEAIAWCREASRPVSLATLRIVKPSEEGLLRQIADNEPDGVLVRNLAAVSFFSQERPGLPLYGDYSLNVANELTADIFMQAGLRRLVPSYDLNWEQMAALFRRFPASHFEAVVHQHMPMFHMEHCVFAHTLSQGKDYRDCGRPCETHRVELRDRTGALHPLVPDVGCRNTLFNAAAQSAADYVPRMKTLGLRKFRVELLRETPEQSVALLEHYAKVLAGAATFQRGAGPLRVLNQLGVTRGTMAWE